MQYIHARGYLFRDIKPENMAIGRRPGKRHIIHVMDFGLAKVFIDPATMQHIGYREGRHLTGTSRYVSLNVHEGKG